MKYCPYCGQANEDAATFCVNCGRSLGGQSDQGGYRPPVHQTAPMPTSPFSSRRGLMVAAVLVMAIVVVFAAIGMVVCLNIPTSDVPEPLSPANGETVNTHYPIFTWIEISGAGGYHVKIIGEGDTEVMDEVVTSASIVSSSYLEDGIYQWTVKADLGGEWSGWSEANTFFIGSSTINRHYQWDFDGKTWTWDMMINSSEYMFYADKPRTFNYASYMTDENRYIESLAQELNDLADSEGWSSYELVSFTLSFVQSLEYTEDDVTTGYDEYPRYPIETLVERGGDCEDTTVLFATLIQADPINIDAVLLILPADTPEHMAAGVAGEGDISGYYYEYDGRNYYYCETTGEGWRLGDIPYAYRTATVEIIQV